MLNVKTFMYDDYSFSANCYVLSDENNNAFIIDPGIDDKDIINFINNHNLNIVGVILTHAHFDHIRGLKLLNKTYKDLKIYIHKEDKPGLTDTKINASNMDKQLFSIDADTIDLVDNDIITGLSEDIKVIHTPFHTCGSICLYLEKNKILFTGDTLFQMSIGRFDLPTSSFRTIKSSLNKLIVLPDETVFYPGHGYSSTISKEKRFNPYLKNI